MIYILVWVFHAFHRLIESYHLDVIVLFFFPFFQFAGRRFDRDGIPAGRAYRIQKRPRQENLFEKRQRPE